MRKLKDNAEKRMNICIYLVFDFDICFAFLFTFAYCLSLLFIQTISEQTDYNRVYDCEMPFIAHFYNTYTYTNII